MIPAKITEPHRVYWRPVSGGVAITGVENAKSAVLTAGTTLAPAVLSDFLFL